MRVLSTKLNLIESVTDSQFYETIIKWLKSAGPYKKVGEMFESCEDKNNVHFVADYCMLDTLNIENEAGIYNVVKLENIFHSQTWTTEIILAVTANEKVVYFHIDCSRDVTRFDEVPAMRSDVIRAFVNSGYIRQPVIPIIENPLDLNVDVMNLIVSGIQEKYTAEIPLILITSYFDSFAGEIDEEILARKLAGLAYVVKCSNEDTRVLKDKAHRKAPFNGTVAIYSKGGKPKQFRKDDVFHGVALDSLVSQEVLRYITAKVDAEAPTWELLHTEIVHAQAKHNEEMLGLAFDENEALDEQLKKAKERISMLVQENLQLKAKTDSLEVALKLSESGKPILKKSDIPEFFEGEQHDLVVSILQRALSTSGTSETRRYELLTDLLKKNQILGNGKEVFEVVKSIFSNGEEMTSKDISELKRIGFEIVSETPHYKLVYKRSKYWFTVSKTASDKKRSGKNLMSDITRRLSVYK